MEIAIPAGITEEQAREWMAVLAERKINAELNANVAVAQATAKAKEDIDTYRKSVGLAPKFEKVEEVKE
jgi:hypothetical protein